MKTKNSDIAVKIFLVVLAVILVGLIIAWSMGVFKDKKSDLDNGTTRINNAISSMAEFDLLVYDRCTITGSLLLELIEEMNNAKDGNRLYGITIEYVNLKEQPKQVTPSPGATLPTGINPNGIFKGEVDRDENTNAIDKLIFTQQK